MPDARWKLTRPAEGNKNAWKHGFYSTAAIVRRREITELLRVARQMITQVVRFRGLRV
jgi:hypothetical protein